MIRIYILFPLLFLSWTLSALPQLPIQSVEQQVKTKVAFTKVMEPGEKAAKTARVAVIFQLLSIAGLGIGALMGQGVFGGFVFLLFLFLISSVFALIAGVVATRNAVKGSKWYMIGRWCKNISLVGILAGLYVFLGIMGATD